MQAIVGRTLSAVVIALLFLDATVNFFVPDLIRTEIESTGFSVEQGPILGIITAICAIVYAIPRTRFIGAVLITGFLGGAITAHFRIGELLSPPQIVSLLLGMATWGALYLRDDRLRGLLTEH
jgi:hypothetical protein